MLSILAGLFTLISVQAAAVPGCPGDLMQCAVQKVLTGYEARGMLSGTLLIRKSGKPTVWGVGLANDATLEENGAGTVYLIASCSKSFVAASILKAKELGKLQLSDTMHTYISEYPARNLRSGGVSVSLEDLLTHTSGIPEAYDTRAIEPKLDKDPLTFTQMMNAIKRRPLHFVPGSTFEYSNTGYLVLGEILRRTTGGSYPDFLNKYFLLPLELRATSVGPPSDRTLTTARSYELNVGSEGRTDFQIAEGRKSLAASELFADTDIYTSAPDLAKWAEALTSGQVLSEASTSEMLTPQLNEYGFGWFIFKDAGGRLAYEHAGDYDGYQSWVRRYPDSDTTIVWLSNQTMPEDKLSAFFESISQAAF